jgi:hypothetical protein
VFVSFTINCAEHQGDGLVEKLTQQAVEQIIAFAMVNRTMHWYRQIQLLWKLVESI